MADVVLIMRADGGLSVINPATAFPEIQVARFAAGHANRPEWFPLVGWRVADESVLPTNREDRDAWTDNGASVAVDPTRKMNLALARLAAIKERAVTAFNNLEDEAMRRDRAIALAAGTGDNVLRQWVTNFVAEVAASTSLADLKSRVAALGGLPTLQASDVKQAVVSRIESADADASMSAPPPPP